MNKAENETTGSDVSEQVDESQQEITEEETSSSDTEQEDNTSSENEEEDKSPIDYEELSSQELIEKLNQADEKINEMKDGFLRAKADVENIRRRSQNEIISARKFAIEGFAQELLSVKDSLDQAAKVELDESQGEAVTKMKQGLELTLKQFDAALSKFSVTEVEAAPGIKFNPEIHQAISMIPGGEVEPDHIVDVMQKGFTLKDRLLRPAMVVVAQSS